MEKWKDDVAAAKEAGKPPPRSPAHPGAQLTGNARPGNIYNGVLKPIIGYGIRGNIWYQGESNAGRAYQYRDLFPFMIENVAQGMGQGRFLVLLGPTRRLLGRATATRAIARGPSFAKPKR